MTEQENYILLLQAFVKTAPNECLNYFFEDPDFQYWATKSEPSILSTIEKLSREGNWSEETT